MTYKAEADGTSVQITKVSNKKTVKIGATVTINGKEYKVTKIAKGAFKGSKVKNVTIDAKNITKAGSVNANAFKGAKKLTKVTIKNAKKTSAVAKKIVKAAKKVNKSVKVFYK